jgi:hypothetical protein
MHQYRGSQSDSAIRHRDDDSNNSSQDILGMMEGDHNNDNLDNMTEMLEE